MIDLQKIADELEFDIESVEMIMESFLKSVKKNISELQQAIQENDLNQISKISHTIKGGAANLLLTDISNIAKEMEISAMKNQTLDYDSSFKKIKQLIEDISL